MKVATSAVTMLTISGVQGLDQVRVFLEDFEPGRGMITITCYGRAWSSYWGAMGGTLSQFVPSVTPHYIVDNLVRGMGQRLKRSVKHEDEYLLRIVKAVQEAIRMRTRFELHGVAP